MAKFRVLIQYRPHTGCKGQQFDHWQDIDETESVSDIFGSAVDYLHTLLEKGNVSLQASGGQDQCDLTEYDINIGPTLGQLV